MRSISTGRYLDRFLIYAPVKEHNPPTRPPMMAIIVKNKGYEGFLKKSIAMRWDRMWSLGKSRNRAASSQNKPIDKKPARKALPGLKPAKRPANNDTTPIIHQGNIISPMAESSAMINMVKKNFIGSTS